MFVLIIVIHYYMVSLITVSIDYKKNNEQSCAHFFFVDFLNFMISVMHDGLSLAS